MVDFGLSREFMLPLNSVNNLETDPLVAIVGALSSLQNDEVGVFQVLFQKTQYDWAEEMLDAVRTFDGTPFFINAPEMIPLSASSSFAGHSSGARIAVTSIRMPIARAHAATT